MKAEQTLKREEALDRALQQIEKAFGKGAILQLDKMAADVEGLSTGTWVGGACRADGSSSCSVPSPRGRRRLLCTWPPVPSVRAGWPPSLTRSTP